MIKINLVKSVCMFLTVTKTRGLSQHDEHIIVVKFTKVSRKKKKK